MTAELLRLAERVEGLTGPDREVDRNIATALCLPWDYSADWRALDEQGARADRPVAFPYTSSLDAAVTLVPDGKEWLLARTHDPHDGGKAYFYASIDESQVHYAATAALALTAAALRALASRDGGRGE